MSDDAKPRTFDFAAHRRAAVEAYQGVRPLYEAFAGVVQRILREALQVSAVAIASIEARAKEVESYGDKAVTPDDADPERPKYSAPLAQITDLTGVRVITFFPKTVEAVDKLIGKEFVVLERVDKSQLLREQERLGYQSIHFLVKLAPNRCDLPEYGRLKDLKAEIQVRTILQHAWAEIEHDIQYKSVETIPEPIKRRFMALAGLFEIADREFQAIQDEDEYLRQQARVSVQEGRLEEVEITPDAVRAYLNRKLGPDGRISEYVYQDTALLLKRLGFTNFRQIDECIAGYNDDHVSREAYLGARQGQVTRFELLLLASMGEAYIEKHRWSDQRWFRAWQHRLLHMMSTAGIPIRSYDPTLNRVLAQSTSIAESP
jgi:ppGpp synthetase/RelA/SpoT-type nucleotidyltranferase